MNKIKKTTAIFLASLILFLSLITSANAEIKASELIIEDESLREENVKHFIMPDGSYKAVFYNTAVHRKDSNGVWQDIDNRMDDAIVENKQAYITTDERAVFSKKVSAEDSTIFELNENGYGIKVSFENSQIKNTSVKLSNHAKKYTPSHDDNLETQYNKIKVIDNNTTLKYKNILKNIDLEYVLSANDIKENIIINKPADEYVYSFVYELDGLVAVLNDNGSITLCDGVTGEAAFYMPAPYMYDGNGERSDEVSYVLTDLGDGVYNLTVFPDAEWINDSERDFPIVIDPTITATAGYYDTFINSASPSTNYGTSEELWIGQTRTTFMKHLYPPSTSTSANITNATLNLYYYYNVSAGSLTAGVYEPYFAWNESALTWNTANAYSNLGLNTTRLGTVTFTASSSINQSSPGIATVDITELMQAWCAGDANYGIALKRESGSNNDVILMAWEAGSLTRSYYEVTYTSYHLPLAEGEYFLKNVGNGNFVQPNESSSTAVNLYTFNAEDNQKWTLTYLFNGSYKIQSSDNGKVLTAPSSTSGNVTQATYSRLATQQWIITLENGKYKLSPKSNQGYYMAADEPLINFANTYNIKLKSSANNYEDNWYLSLEDEYVHLSFLSRIFYDSTAMSSFSTSEIEQAFQTVATGFKNKFHIFFTNTSTNFSSEIDVITDTNCHVSSDVSSYCTSECASVINCNTLHHRSAYRLNGLLNSDEYYTCRVVSYALCVYKDSTHKKIYGQAILNGKDSIVSASSINSLKSLIQHELSHNFGARHETCMAETIGQKCTLAGDFGYWCDACEAAIKSNY